MVRSKDALNRLIIMLVLLNLTSHVFSESLYKRIIYTAFITRDMNKWKNVIRSIEATNSTNTLTEKLELVNYYYGYIGYLVGKKQYEPAELLIDKGELLIGDVLRISPKNATAYSYKGSFMGFQIGIDKYKAIYLGSKSRYNIDKAIGLDPLNVQALIDKGNILYYAPVVFGGDKKEALIYFLKGAKLMERNKDTYQNWEYLNLLTIIASAYEKIDKLKEAKLMYEKIIGIEPDILWVKDELYPRLLTKM